MLIILFVMLLMLIMVIALPWLVIRHQRRFLPLFLALASVAAIVLWFSWTRDLTYTVSGYVNGQLAGSHKEDFRTWFKLFVTGELAVIFSATIALVAGGLRGRRRASDPPPSEAGHGLESRRLPASPPSKHGRDRL